MVNANPNNAYLTEQTRLEAQRRMLAERYGLLSDDSDDGENAPRSSNASSSAPESLNGASSNHSTSAAVGAPLPPAKANGRPTAVSSTSAPSTAVTDPSSSADPPSTLTVTTLALPAAGGSSVVDTPAINTSFSPDEVHDSSPLASSSPPPMDAWPPIEIIDPTHGNRICSRFCFPHSGARHSAARNVRVTQITHYSSQLLESHQRKIAINEQIMSYGVGGHVRTMLRHGAARYLLKGHNSVVADIEFLSFLESRLDVPATGHVSILGSVADDGSVYVWKLIRNINGENETLDVADAIRFEHPDFDKRRSYKRIAFRPGPNSIIAENGIGVAMLLLDIHSTDLRIVEVVKMNDKMMVRDKFLRARHEYIDGDERVEGNISAAAWFSETIVVTARGGHVFLWNADNTFSCCIGHVPRENTLPVTAIYTLQGDVMIFVVSHGRQLEVWSIKEIAQDMSAITLQMNQTLTLFDEDKPDVHCVTAVDPAEELVTISNVRHKSFFVLHFNSSVKAFDAITEVPQKHSIYSFCIAPISEASLPPLPPSISGASRKLQDPLKEIGVWCVQPLGIQVVHLPLHVCRPVSNIIPEIYPKPILKTIRGNLEKKPSLVAATQASSPKTSEDSSTIPAKRLFMPSLPAKPSTGVDSSGATNPGNNPGRGGASGPAGGNSSASGTQAKGINDARGRGGSGSDSENKGLRNNEDGGTKKPMSMTSISAPPENPSVSADELVEVLLNAAKKVIASFEETGSQRAANDKAKTDKLMESVAETAESNMERFINSSMKKVLAETLIPGVSEIIADSRKAMKEKTKFEGKLAREHFEEVLEKADINKSLGSACNEMCRQVTNAVSQSLSSKYESVVQPIVSTVNDAAEDLTTSLSLLRSEVSKLKEDRGNNSTEGVIEIEPEDVRRTIEEQVREGHIDEAFLTALDKRDVPLVMWLCSKFEVGTFFVEHSLSQVALLSLAAQLGQELEEGEVMLKIGWLREVILALDPDAEEIEPISRETMQSLEAKIDDLRKNKEFMDEHPGLERKFKLVARLLTTHIQN